MTASASSTCVLRPPLADRRLRLLDDGRVALELETPWRDGTEWLTLPADTFIERLCSTRFVIPEGVLVPKPHEHTILYRGVLGAHSKRRATVVPCRETTIAHGRRTRRGAHG